MTRLEALDLDACPVGNDGVAAIANAEGAAGLRRLSLARSGLRAAAFDALGAAERLRGLRELNLQSNDTDRHSVAALAGGPYDAMERLWLELDSQDVYLFADGWLQIGTGRPAGSADSICQGERSHVSPGASVPGQHRCRATRTT